MIGRWALAPVLALLAAGSLHAALVPEALGEFVRKSVEPVSAADAPLAEELGLEESEKAVYETKDGRRLEIQATRYYDDTGAFAAFLWQKPQQGEAVEHGERAWKGSGFTLIQIGNYLVKTTGDAPLDDDLELMLGYMPRMRMTVDPPVLAYTPDSGERPGTARHVLGPTGLERLAPEIPPSAVGFHFGAEGHYAEYDTDAGPMRLLLLSYPTLQMARAQAEELQKIGSAVAKRTGPLVAVVLNPSSADEAQRLLARVRYEAEVTLDYKEPGRHDDPYLLLMDIVVLCGILVALCIVGGILVAGGRHLAGRFAPNSLIAPPEGDGTVHLNINDPPR
jgi:hypothetical protein